MDSTGQWTGGRFTVRQETALKVDRYAVRGLQPDGTEGEVLAVAEAKRFSLREETIFYADASRTRVLFTTQESAHSGIGDGFEVRDAAGDLIGGFEEKPVASLLRSTWVLHQPGSSAAVGRERNWFVAVLRRVWDFLPLEWVPFLWPYHFDFSTDGKPVFKVDKKFGLRDRYVLDIAVPGMDPRLVVAQVVALATSQE
ncbi:hypothetical protein ACFYWD_36530 [Streptomyces sp. NPDC003781]|uniref:hypothetical protein n=1 Tax=Streptomyces sp. NPDC003781 TaxID=3364686 RepID=UPI003676AD32